MSDFTTTATIRTCQNEASSECFSTRAVNNNQPKKIFSKALLKKETPYSRSRDNPGKQGRNIEYVILGDVRFQAWYSSWYPKELFGERNKYIKELHVCPRCFAYSRGEDQRELRAWLKHWHCCSGLSVPGEKIYVHGDWIELNKNCSNNRGIWSVWEVDGAEETLFCQKLSLFSKLFLDNKTVFFDVSSFNFFLLVYTSPNTTADLRSAKSSNSQIIGFFSKEKLSWDNNNLACILIFPPWQRKGLGSLLIGISYAIAQRENIIGGPERPISDLGMKGYRGFWGREIARFLLSIDTGTHPCVNIETISLGTWISPDDCLAMIREMDIIKPDDTKKYILTGDHATKNIKRAKESEGEQNKNFGIFLDKERVRNWVTREGLQLSKAVSETGFRPGYAIKSSKHESNVNSGLNSKD